MTTNDTGIRHTTYVTLIVPVHTYAAGDAYIDTDDGEPGPWGDQYRYDLEHEDEEWTFASTEERNTAEDLVAAALELAFAGNKAAQATLARVFGLANIVRYGKDEDNE